MPFQLNGTNGYRNGGIDYDDLSTTDLSECCNVSSFVNKRKYIFVQNQNHLNPRVFFLLQLTSRGKIRALLQKNFLRMWRNVGVMLFIFALPVMQVILFCLAIGRDPTGLRLAIANMEMNGTEVSQVLNQLRCFFLITPSSIVC